MIFFIINNYSNYYFGMIEPLNFSVVIKNLTFFSRKVSLDGTIEPYKRSNRKVESSISQKKTTKITFYKIQFYHKSLLILKSMISYKFIKVLD